MELSRRPACSSWTPTGGSVRPDLVVLDVILPDGDGFETYRALRGAGVDAPVLFRTAHDRTEARVHGLMAGGEGVGVEGLLAADVDTGRRVGVGRGGGGHHAGDRARQRGASGRAHRCAPGNRAWLKAASQLDQSLIRNAAGLLSRRS